MENIQDKLTSLLKSRENYYKEYKSKTQFYSNKLNSLLQVEKYVTNVNNQKNCFVLEITSYDDILHVVNELDFDNKETTLENLSSKDYPYTIMFCDKSIV